jgi:hypothetical protein
MPRMQRISREKESAPSLYAKELAAIFAKALRSEVKIHSASEK